MHFAQIWIQLPWSTDGEQLGHSSPASLSPCRWSQCSPQPRLDIGFDEPRVLGNFRLFCDFRFDTVGIMLGYLCRCSGLDRHHWSVHSDLLLRDQLLDPSLVTGALNRRCVQVRHRLFLVEHQLMVVSLLDVRDKRSTDQRVPFLLFSGGVFVTLMITSIWPQYAHLKNSVPEIQRATSADFVSFILFWSVSKSRYLLHY